MMEPALSPEEWAKRSAGTWAENDGVMELRDADPDGDWGAAVLAEGTFDGRLRHALAALCLYGQPFGFTWDDVEFLGYFAHTRKWRDKHAYDDAVNLAARIVALLPPPTEEIDPGVPEIAALLPPRENADGR